MKLIIIEVGSYMTSNLTHVSNLFVTETTHITNQDHKEDKQQKNKNKKNDYELLFAKKSSVNHTRKEP